VESGSGQTVREKPAMRNEAETVLGMPCPDLHARTRALARAASSSKMNAASRAVCSSCAPPSSRT